MKPRHWMAGVLIFAGAGAVCLGALFTWTAGGADDDWDTSANWSTQGQRPYPSTTNDDALFPAGADGWYVGLITEQIDDLTLNTSRDFYSAGGTVTLTVDSITIAGPAPGGASYTTVTVFENATITTQQAVDERARTALRTRAGFPRRADGFAQVEVAELRVKGTSPMQVRHWCAIIGTLVMLGATQVALGTTYYFDVYVGNWNDPNNWDPYGTPDADDTAVIGQNSSGQIVARICHVTDEQSVGTLVVKGNGL